MMESTEDITHADYVRDTASGAANVLSRSFGRPLELEIARNFREPQSRSVVLRCLVHGRGHDSEIPDSIIVKRFRGDAGEPYDPDDADRASPRARLLNEWAGTLFLQEIGGEHAAGPSCYGGDDRLGIVVLEDFGDGPCLADYLQGNDPAQAEAALFAYITTLGRLHAASIHQHSRYTALRRELAAGTNALSWDPVYEWHTDTRARFEHACATLDVALPATYETEFAAIGAALTDPGPFLAYSVGDTCPDNHRYIASPTGGVGAVRFFDMEFGGYRHALLDAAYVWMPFPTCWCVNRLPDHLPPLLEAAYRAELMKNCPLATDDQAFHCALVEACAAWFILTVSWDFARVIERDDDWGIATVRQRFPLRAANVASLCERSGHLPALGAVARDFTTRVTARWGESVNMPLYPPFRKRSAD